jgi:hypothetical protein
MIYEFCFQQRLVPPTLNPAKYYDIRILFPVAVHSPNSKPCHTLRHMGSVLRRTLVAQCQLAQNNIAAHNFNTRHNRCIVIHILWQ